MPKEQQIYYGMCLLTAANFFLLTTSVLGSLECKGTQYEGQVAIDTNKSVCTMDLERVVLRVLSDSNVGYSCSNAESKYSVR